MVSRRSSSQAVLAGLLLVALACSGCSAVLYTPISHQAPMHEEFGEVRVTGDFLVDGSVSAQVSASPLPHVFVRGSMMRTLPSDGDVAEHRFGVIGGGLYGMTRPETLGGRLQLSGAISGELGRGTVGDNGQEFFGDDFRIESDIERRALQLDLGFRTRLSSTSEIYLFSVGSLRFSRVRLSDVLFTVRDATPPDSRLIDDLDGTFIEPGFRSGIEAGGARMYAMTGWVEEVDTFDNPDVTYQIFYVGLGLSFDLSRPFRK